LAQYFSIHPNNPQPRLIRQAVEIIREGGVLVYPTDSCYALGCRLGDKSAVDRIRRIRGVDENHHMTLVCRDLAEIGKFARVDNMQYRTLRANTPGSYTFILKATRELPRRLQHPKRSTIGLRVPDHPVVQALLSELHEPLLSSTLILPGDDAPLTEAEAIRERLEHEVDLILDGGNCGLAMTTVIDLSEGTPRVTRVGKGALEPFGLAASVLNH
jgi:tRNA threonylcarbamoyl adenosine modification protein (Sua5/YciO/YrdC/YwlC family)